MSGQWDGQERRVRPQRRECQQCPLNADGYCKDHQAEMAEKRLSKTVLTWSLRIIGSVVTIALILLVPMVREVAHDVGTIKTSLSVLTAEVSSAGKRQDERLENQRLRMERMEAEHRLLVDKLRR